MSWSDDIRSRYTESELSALELVGGIIHDIESQEGILEALRRIQAVPDHPVFKVYQQSVGSALDHLLKGFALEKMISDDLKNRFPEAQKWEDYIIDS